MVAPLLSWLTVFSTAAGSSERFSFFSLSCGAVCCVAACDASAQVKNSTAIVHFMNRIRSSSRGTGEFYAAVPYSGLTGNGLGDKRDVARARRIRSPYPPCPSLRSRMNKPSNQVLGLLAGVALAWPGASSAQGFKVAKYSIGGDGGTDYLTAEPGTGRVFVSRSTHVMVID